MPLFEPDKNHNRAFDRTIRYIGLSFAGLAFVLLVVFATSLRITMQVQKGYNHELTHAYKKLELVNELFKNKEQTQTLLRAHIYATTPTVADSLRRHFLLAKTQNSEIITKLDSQLEDSTQRGVLKDLSEERKSYYLHADSLLQLNSSDFLIKEKDSLRRSLAPYYNRHQALLIKLNDLIAASARNKTNEALGLFTYVLDDYAILLFLVFASVMIASYLLRKVFKRLKQENKNLSFEMVERQQLQRSLLENQQNYKNLFNRNPIPMWTYDQNTYRFLEVNQAAVLEYGYNEEEFLQMTLFDIRPEEDKPRLLEILQQNREEADFPSTKVTHKRKDGSLFSVEIRSHAMPQRQQVSPKLVVAVNVQERELAVEQLQRNEKLLREVSSSVPGIVYQYQMESDESFSLPYISEGVRDLCGVTQEEVYQDPLLLYKYLHPSDLQEVMRSTVQSYRNLTPWEQEVRVWQPSQKKYIWLRGHSLPSSKGNGTVLWNGTFINITKQKEAQEQLKRQEAKLRALLDSSLQAIFLLDENMTVISFNKEAAKDVRRYLLKDLKVGQSMVNFVARSEVHTLKENHSRAMRGEMVVYEAGHGDYWHEITYLPVTGPEQSIIGVALNIRDISEQKKSFETIRRNELQLARAQQLAKLGSWEYDIKQDILTWSNGTYAIFGVKKDSFVPSMHSMLSRIHPDERSKVQAAHFDAIQNKSQLNIEHTIILPDGSQVSVLEVAEVLCDESGEAIKLYGTVQDVTERKMAEQEITEAKNLFQTTIENIPEVIFTANPDLSIIYISPQCEHITGYPKETFLGDKAIWLKFVPLKDKKLLIRQILPNVLAGQLQEYEIRLTDSIGRTRWLLLRLSPGTDSTGKVTRIYGSASDMTVYKEAEARQQELSQQLLKQNQNLQQFAYIVSHNLRAPIANMLGLTSIFNRNEIGSPINQKVVDNLTKSAQLLDTTIRDLNDLLTIRSRAENEYEAVSFNCLLQDVLELLKGNFETCKATITYDFDAAPTVNTVSSYAQSILLNLISNAFKYKSPDRKLVISITSLKVNHYICLRVKDNGLGIDLEKQKENLFGLYKRFHKGIEGKGIGLHLVKTQVEMLEGKVEVESKPQEGTTFSIYFKS